MMIELSAIELDTSIQCRAVIDTGVINDYAERMTEGDVFPPVELFGTTAKCWIGDGWHRALAAKSIECDVIAAKLNPGGRAEALKHALGANALHGQRRSNADKRRCVEIALREFPQMSSRALAKMCGVSPDFVARVRPSEQVSSNDTSVTGQDGKSYPARRAAPEPQEPVDYYEPMGRTAEPRELRVAAPLVAAPKQALGPPSNGMDFARMAIMDLEQIHPDDVKRDDAFQSVVTWISNHWKPRSN